MKRPKSTLCVTLKSGESLRFFISPRPTIVGFDEETMKKLKSFYIEINYKPVSQKGKA